MALIACKECGKEISKKAKSCPHCGAKNKSGLGCLPIFLGIMGLGLIGIIAIGVLAPKNPNNNINNSTSSEAVEKKEETKFYNEGQEIKIGYTSYLVTKSWYAKELNDDSGFLHEKPDGVFLLVQIKVTNKDKEARMIAPFKLVDQKNAEYESSSKGALNKKALGILNTLNPNVSKEGFLVFDLPKEKNNYKLKVSGGYWSNENALVTLNPIKG